MSIVPRPDARACLARIAPRVNALQGRDVYRINELVKTANGVATGRRIEICPLLPAGTGGSGPAGRGSATPLGKNSWEYYDASGLVGCSLWGVIQFGEMPIGMRFRPYVVQSMWATSYYFLNVEIFAQISQVQLGWGSLRLQ